MLASQICLQYDSMRGSDEDNALKCFVKEREAEKFLHLCPKRQKQMLCLWFLLFSLIHLIFNIYLDLILTRIQIFSLSGHTNAPQEIPCM